MRSMLVLAAVLLLSSGPARAAGLLAPTDQTLPPLRVTDHLVDVEIRDRVALTSITQTFHNDTNRRLEATYLFPLPEHADLTNFQMTFNGKMVEGEVLPADEARRIYEDIVRRKRDPGLIEFIGRRLLQMRVFPIEPESDTTIKLRYQQVTRPISGMQGYHYPLRTRKTAGQAYGMVRFAVSLETQAPLKNIWSPSHAVEIVRQGERKAKIAYEASGGSLEDDFVLLYDTADSDLGLSVVGYRPDEAGPGHFVLMLTPKQLWPADEYQPQDVVFVVDTSGSMAGDKIDQARRALQFCIDKLDEHDRFSVVRFSTGFDVLFDEPAPATRENRAQAQNFADSFSASGGTNIADTLQHVARMRSRLADDDEGRPFVVVFLTDGQGNRGPDEILASLAQIKDAARVRIFPFGVGHDVNTILLDRLANDYAGRPTYVQPGENLELVMGDFFSVVSRPVLTDLQLTLPAAGVTERFPAVLGDLYSGQQLIIAGKFAKPATGPVTLTAMRNGERVEYAWPNVAFAHAPQAEYVPAVWAGRKIAYLIDQIRAHGESQEMIAEVVALSREYGIQTPYSSWLVAPEEHPVVVGLGRRSKSSLPGTARRTIDRVAPQSAPGRGAGFGTGGGEIFGDPADEVTLREAEEAVTDGAGRVGNLVARKNAQMRGMSSRDLDRLDTNGLAVRKLDGRWYQWIDGYLVDGDVQEDTEVVTVLFGSDAYFDLVLGRPDLREAFAAGRHVLVMVAPGRAVLVADDEGIEKFSPAEMEQMGIDRR